MSNLSKPSKVASILDWKKTYTVLAVNFHKNRVGIAVASHPSLGVPCLELEPLRFEDRRGNSTSIVGAIDRDCLERFADIIEEHKVCGVVVNWPLQRDTGRMGAACGRVLFALEQLWERSNETITMENHESTDHELHINYNNINSSHQRGGLLSRPFCLWDAGHINPADPANLVDDFGRCASYGKEKETPKAKEQSSDRYFDKEKNYYFASKEQYYEDELTVVLGVWDDFCKEHWPELCAIKGNEMENEEQNNNNNTDPPRSLYSDMGQPPAEMPSRLQEMTKKKKSLVTMR